MIAEHIPHVGDLYEQGINGKRVAVVGFSHYVSDQTPDSPDFTVECVRKMVAGEWATDPIFFRLIAKAFGMAGDREFWRRVMFFNWAPHGMGGSAEKFDNITKAQESRAAARFGELLDAYHPDVALIFTTKPKLKALGLYFTPLPVPLEHFKVAKRGTTSIYSLRHTQGATSEELRGAVEAALGDLADA